MMVAGFVEVVEKLDAVERAAWTIYLKATNDGARVRALRTVLEALRVRRDVVQKAEIKTSHLKQKLDT